MASVFCLRMNSLIVRALHFSPAIQDILLSLGHSSYPIQAWKFGLVITPVRSIKSFNKKNIGMNNFC